MTNAAARKTILVVDDDPDLLDYAGQVLEERGYRVLRAPDGASALSLLRGTGAVDLLLTDVMMPGIDGIEVARRALRQLPTLRVLFTSGYASKLMPGSRLLRKPYRSQQLAGEVAAALAS